MGPGLEQRGLPPERGAVGIGDIHINRIIVVRDAVYSVSPAPSGNAEGYSAGLAENNRRKRPRRLPSGGRSAAQARVRPMPC